MKITYCCQKGCTYRLCKHHYCKAKEAIENKILEPSILRIKDMEGTVGCRTRATAELNKQKDKK